MLHDNCFELSMKEHLHFSKRHKVGSGSLRITGILVQDVAVFEECHL